MDKLVNQDLTLVKRAEYRQVHSIVIDQIASQ